MNDLISEQMGIKTNRHADEIQEEDIHNRLRTIGKAIASGIEKAFLEDFSQKANEMYSTNPMIARWIGGELGKCSECGHEGCASDIWDGCGERNYCPNCGALIIRYRRADDE